MSDGDPKQKRAWLELERFRSARAFGYGGCLLAVLIASAGLSFLISFLTRLA